MSGSKVNEFVASGHLQYITVVLSVIGLSELKMDV